MEQEWQKMMEKILDSGFEDGDRMLRESIMRRLETIDNLIRLTGGRLRSRQVIAHVIVEQHERLGGVDRDMEHLQERSTSELMERIRVLDIARDRISKVLWSRMDDRQDSIEEDVNIGDKFSQAFGLNYMDPLKIVKRVDYNRDGGVTDCPNGVKRGDLGLDDPDRLVKVAGEGCRGRCSSFVKMGNIGHIYCIYPEATHIVSDPGWRVIRRHIGSGL